jgi:hypothetical protein
MQMVYELLREWWEEAKGAPKTQKKERSSAKAPGGDA